MIRIYEGADATGKTTLATAFTMRAGGALLHYGKPDGRAIDMYIARVARWLDEGVTLDRSFIGSAVWSSLGFHPATLSRDAWNVVCEWYAEHGTHAAIVVRPLEAIKATLAARGETEQQYMEAAAGQDEFLRLVASHEILYIPTTIASSDLLHAQEGITTWN